MSEYRSWMQRDLTYASAILGFILFALLKLILVCTCFRRQKHEEIEEEDEYEVEEDDQI